MSINSTLNSSSRQVDYYQIASNVARRYADPSSELYDELRQIAACEIWAASLTNTDEPYLAVRATNAVLDELRREGRRAERFGPLCRPSKIVDPRSVGDVLDDYELTDEERSVAELRLIGDEPRRSVAEFLDVSVKALRNLERRVVAKLRAA